MSWQGAVLPSATPRPVAGCLGWVYDPQAARAFLGCPLSEATAYRALWSAVIQRAVDDIATAPVDSPPYAHAVAFFTSHDTDLASDTCWGFSRFALADFLDLHADDIAAGGLRAINARRRADGLPAMAAVPAPAPVARKAPVPFPRLVATPPLVSRIGRADLKPPRGKRHFGARAA